MPIYEFLCDCGVVTEEYFPVRSNQLTLVCKCGNEARRCLSVGSIHTDTPPWINNDLRNAIQGDGERPIETRAQLDAHCKEKGFVPRS